MKFDSDSWIIYADSIKKWTNQRFKKSDKSKLD